MSRKRTLYASELINRNVNEDVIINIKFADKILIFAVQSVPKEYLDKQVKQWYMVKTLNNRILVIYI